MTTLRAAGMVVDQDGDGVAAILIHGLGGTSNSWQAVMPSLAGMRVIRPDLPGAGRSATPDGAIDVAMLADRIVRLASELAVGSFHLIGHSFGTLVAQHVAMRRPALVRSLTLFGPIIEPGEVARERLRGRAKLVRDAGMEAVADQLTQGGLSVTAPEENGTACAFVRESHMRQHAEGFARSCEALAGAHRADPKQLTMPVLAVAGDEDAISPPSNAWQLADEIAGARAAILAGCGHWAPVEKPRECMRLIADFVRAGS